MSVSCVQIPDEKFPVLLQYVEGLRGGARDTTVQKALALVNESGQAPEDGIVQQRAQRAREVIQLLSWNLKAHWKYWGRDGYTGWFIALFPNTDWHLIVVRLLFCSYGELQEVLSLLNVCFCVFF